jgi:hypothetical protein
MYYVIILDKELDVDQIELYDLLEEEDEFEEPEGGITFRRIGLSTFLLVALVVLEGFATTAGSGLLALDFVFIFDLPRTLYGLAAAPGRIGFRSL